MEFNAKEIKDRSTAVAENTPTTPNPRAGRHGHTLMIASFLKEEGGVSRKEKNSRPED